MQVRTKSIDGKQYRYCSFLNMILICIVGTKSTVGNQYHICGWKPKPKPLLKLCHMLPWSGGQELLDEDWRDNRQDVDQVHHHQRGGRLCKAALQGFKGLNLTRIRIESFAPELFVQINSRNCLFPEEGDSNLFAYYTKSNCLLECAWKVLLLLDQIWIDKKDFYFSIKSESK